MGGVGWRCHGKLPGGGGFEPNMRAGWKQGLCELKEQHVHVLRRRWKWESHEASGGVSSLGE